MAHPKRVRTSSFTKQRRWQRETHKRSEEEVRLEVEDVLQLLIRKFVEAISQNVSLRLRQLFKLF